jgi:hypothetical protein
MNASVNSICTQSQIHSAGGAAPGKSVGRGSNDRPPAADTRPCAERGTPGYSREPEGAETGQAESRRRERGAQAARARRQRLWGREGWQEGKGCYLNLILG